MSYRPDNQSLEPGITKIVEGMDILLDAIEVRLNSDDWTTEHLNEIAKLGKRLFGIKLELLKLKSKTW